MKQVWLISLSLFLVACGNQEAPEAPVSQADANFPAPTASLSQLMRGILYPSSEIIFAAQSDDPQVAAAVAKAAAEASGGEVLYTGWEGVENAGLMLSEAARLILTPGRLCENGRPVPVANEDFAKFARGLIDAGQTTYEAAQRKDLDAMLDAAGVVTDACAACHDIYREGQMRCVAN